MQDYNYETFPLDMDEPLFEGFREVLRPGDRAPDGMVVDARTREELLLSSLWRRSPLVLEFGSLT
ncbi:MAG: hypothetical protein JRJ84_21390 [Deltaproteobacteria bacterium]|nr:hypothetical protein [Deltaproteobacteria bacterium]